MSRLGLKRAIDQPKKHGGLNQPVTSNYLRKPRAEDGFLPIWHSKGLISLHSVGLISKGWRGSDHRQRCCSMLQEPARSGMLSSTTGIFREPDDFAAAMREYGCTNLLVTDRCSFRARLTPIALHRLRLLSAEESASRTAFFSVPRDTVLVHIPLGDGLLPIWGGTATRAGEILSLDAGDRMHVRSTSRCRWGAILLPTRLLLNYARTITGDALMLPSGMCRWRPSAKAFRRLFQLHTSATRVANTQAGVITRSEPANALGQEVIEAVVACLFEGSAQPGSDAQHRHADIMGRFEDLLRAHPNEALNSAAVCAALDVSGRTLRNCCRAHLGMGPIPYMRLRRMQLVHQALRRADPATARISQLAARYGLGQAGRFAGDYRAWSGELPSVTLRHSADQ
jgi:AraC-like DNA-binding protein